ncbi:MAG: response regulator, partial [bacterium]|nr:response regulator [bacterium]
MNHSQPASLKANIVIVDDTRASLRLLEELLQEQGYTVRPMPEGRLALMAVQANPPDLILLDIKMPGMSGYDVCEQLKADPQTADIPIIFLSALDETIDKVKAFALGGVDYITKPFQAEEVLARVETHLVLRNLQKHLEELVEGRTTELQHTNEHLQQEIAERKRAERTVRASEQQYRALAENVADGIRIVQEGETVFVNEALCSMLGYTTDELLKSDPLAIVHDAYKELFVKRFHTLLQGLSVPSIQAVCLSKDGGEIWIEGQSRVITWAGKPAILTTIRDITERKLRERELEETRAHLEKENLVLRSTIKDRYKFGKIIGKSPVMQDIYELLTYASASDAHVTICGESGTGKELIAHTIHQLSDRHKKAFIPVNCG